MSKVQNEQIYKLINFNTTEVLLKKCYVQNEDNINSNLDQLFGHILFYIDLQ